jgi:adenine phosphoribosyltransferase
MNLRKYIRDIPDFPKKGIVFYDITPMLKDPHASKECFDILVEEAKKYDFDLIVSPESRGFLFGPIVANKLGKGFIPVRKPGKLPYETISISYELEYGHETLEMHKDAIDKGDKVLIIDDILATGGTVEAIAKQIETLGAEVVGIVSFMELSFLHPRKKLSKYKVSSIIVEE